MWHAAGRAVPGIGALGLAEAPSLRLDVGPCNQGLSVPGPMVAEQGTDVHWAEHAKAGCAGRAGHGTTQTCSNASRPVQSGLQDWEA